MKKIINYIRTHRSFFIVLSIGILVRLFFMSMPAFKIDMDAWISWGGRVLEVGPREFYNTTDWTAYFPGYIYILWLTAAVESLFFSPSSRAMLEFLYKLVPVLFDLGIGVLIYVILEHLRKNSTVVKSSAISIFCALLYFVAPFAIFNGAIWGQADSVHAFFMLFSLYSLYREKPNRAMILLALAVSVKPQALFMAPVYVMYYLQHPNLKKIVTSLGVFILTFVCVVVPFYGTNLYEGIKKVIDSNNEAYGYNSLNTFNFWGMYGFWIKDSTVHWFGLSMKFMGFIMYCQMMIVGFLFYAYFFLLKKHPFTLPVASLLAVYSIFTTVMFATQMHERYMYPMFGFLLVFVGYYTLKKYSHSEFKPFINPLSIYFVVISLLHAINHYYVYIYYAYFNQGVPIENSWYYFISNNILVWSYIMTALYFIFVLALPYYLKDQHLYDKGK